MELITDANGVPTTKLRVSSFSVARVAGVAASGSYPLAAATLVNFHEQSDGFYTMALEDAWEKLRTRAHHPAHYRP